MVSGIDNALEKKIKLDKVTEQDGWGLTLYNVALGVLSDKMTIQQRSEKLGKQ